MNRIESKKGGANVRMPPPLVFIFGMAAGWALDTYVRRLPVPIGETFGRLAAAVAALAGLLLILSALVLFRRTGQDPQPWKPSPELIGQGPYRFSRNPIYLGMLLLQCGVGFAFDSLWIVLWSAPSLLGVHFAAVLPEERYLAHRFGEGYRRYAATTARYLGWPKTASSNRDD